MKNRLRLRIPSRRGDAEFHAELERAMRGVEGVTDVHVNPTTASVLLSHEGEADEVLRAAEARGLFEVAAETPRATPLAHLYDRLAEADRDLVARTEGRWDLATLGFYALLGGSIVQLARGKFMPAGATLALQAFGLVLKQAERRR
jgi:hypothetical protein